VKNSTKALTVVAAMGLLVVMFGVTTLLAATVTVAEDTVEWASATGDNVTYVKPDSTAHFFITDAALETTKSGTAVFSGLTADTYFDVANSKAGTSAANATATGVTVTITASDYASTTPAATPWTAAPTVTVGTSEPQVINHSKTLGTATIATEAAASATTTVTFVYHIQDVWLGSSTTARRAKVTSTSDPAGEYITISEVVSVTDTTADPDSKVFHGSIALSSDASDLGTNDDGVWVQDGDTLTVTYLKSDGTTIDTDTVTVDGVKPTVAAIIPADGTITNVVNPTITFEVTDTGSGMSATTVATDITIAFLPVSITTNATSTVPAGEPAFQAISDGFRVIFATGTSWLTKFAAAGVANNTAFQWQITATDVAGNVQTVTGSSLDLTIDTTKPTATSAATGTSWDTTPTTPVEKTGVNTAVKVTFSEDLDATTVAVADFTVAGVAPSAAVVGTTTGNKDNVYLTVAAQLPDAKPAVKVVGSISDLAGNTLDITATAATQTATDGLKPSFATTISQALSVKDDKVKVTVVPDEKVAVSGLTVSINGASSATGNGKLTTTAPSPLSHEGTLTIAAGTATGKYGVSIQVTDLGNNAKDNLTKVTDETMAAANLATGGLVVTLANGPIADMDFDGDVDASDITAMTDDGAVVTISAVDASQRTVTVSAAIATDSVVKITYHYVTDAFEVDQTAPSVVFDPVDEAKIQNASPFIRLTFDEDEYPGDTFKTVTLTKADVLNPDGTTTDLLATFVSSDNIEFIWAASDLALGAYKLTVSATDSAGNKLTDATSDFTVEARSLYSIALRPGWNLISLPGAPVDSGVGTVVAELDVDVVLTYDTATASWLTAVRGTDGIFVGDLTTVDSSTAYWVHTDTFDPIKVDIPGFTAGSQTVPPAFDLGVGWNMVPVSTMTMGTTTVDADDYFSGLTWSRAYGYDNATAKFTSILPGTTATPSTATVAVSQGYWLYLTTAGTLVP
jgi:hypothetical protein